MKGYITKNHYEGWKVVLDGKIVDCTNPIFHSHNVNNDGLQMCRNFCMENNIEVIRECL